MNDKSDGNNDTTRRRVTCPRCGKFVELEVLDRDGSAVCPCCENEIVVVVR